MGYEELVTERERLFSAVEVVCFRIADAANPQITALGVESLAGDVRLLADLVKQADAVDVAISELVQACEGVVVVPLVGLTPGDIEAVVSSAL